LAQIKFRKIETLSGLGGGVAGAAFSNDPKSDDSEGMSVFFVLTLSVGPKMEAREGTLSLFLFLDGAPGF
jgi:hypothetical protein